MVRIIAVMVQSADSVRVLVVLLRSSRVMIL